MVPNKNKQSGERGREEEKEMIEERERIILL
jgi:hypothetical protein